jgi:hypothetical protein
VPGDRRPAGKVDFKNVPAPLSREAFRRQFGERLQFDEYAGRVIRIDGSGISDGAFDRFQKVDGFRPLDAAAVSARAREVFEASRGILGISEGTEFTFVPPTTGESSAQSIAQQSKNGVPIVPGGLVTILLGPNGEVRGLDSSIYPKTEIANVASLPPPVGAREILYVTQSAPVAVLRYAYETRDHGIQNVVDAQTGGILLRRDRRIR